MTMFSICTAYVPEGQLDAMYSNSAAVEKYFTRENGVLARHFFQCRLQPHIVWAFTEWESEERHNDAAQSILKTRRDDRIAAIKYGPEPYFEIFAEEEHRFSVGELTSEIESVVVGHVLIGADAREAFHRLRDARWTELEAQGIPWLRVFHNTYNRDEFVFFMGFVDEADRERFARDPYALEEYLFTGLEDPMKMSAIAGYNQYLCSPLDIMAAASAVT